MPSSEAPMRILAAADIHGALSVYEWLLQMATAHRADLMILAGDLFAADSVDEQRKQASQIISVLVRGAFPCFYLMGNDDNTSLDYEDARIRPIHGRRLGFGSFNFVGYQYTPPFLGTVFVKSEAEIEKDVEPLELLLDSQSVLVTHAPAHGSLDLSFSGEHVGSHSLATLLGRRSVLAHIHGHIHECFGHESNHFNVAAAGQRRCALIELPSVAYRVIHGD